MQHWEEKWNELGQVNPGHSKPQRYLLLDRSLSCEISWAEPNTALGSWTGPRIARSMSLLFLQIWDRSFEIWICGQVQEIDIGLHSLSFEETFDGERDQEGQLRLEKHQPQQDLSIPQSDPLKGREGSFSRIFQRNQFPGWNSLTNTWSEGIPLARILLIWWSLEP